MRRRAFLGLTAAAAVVEAAAPLAQAKPSIILATTTFKRAEYGESLFFPDALEAPRGQAR